jgi:dihydrofolate reductase
VRGTEFGQSVCLALLRGDPADLTPGWAAQLDDPSTAPGIAQAGEAEAAQGVAGKPSSITLTSARLPAVRRHSGVTGAQVSRVLRCRESDPGSDHTLSTDELSFDQEGLPVMSRVRVHNFSVSLDGFSTGADQSLEAPFGHAGDRLMRWFTGTRSCHVMQGRPGGSTGTDDAFASNWGPGIGAEIMGRNKFGPQRGPWTDEEWKGWWGEEPPFGTPVFVLTHHLRPSIQMKGSTTFHFTDASPAQALAAARAAAPGLDVRIGGGPAAVTTG